MVAHVNASSAHNQVDSGKGCGLLGGGINPRAVVQCQNASGNKTIPAGSLCVSCIGTIGVVSITTQDCQTNQQINSVVLAEANHENSRSPASSVA